MKRVEIVVRVECDTGCGQTDRATANKGFTSLATNRLREKGWLIGKRVLCPEHNPKRSKRVADKRGEPDGQ